MKIILGAFAGIFLLVSCSENDDQIGKIITSDFQYEISIHSGDTLKVNLGSFGDEEGAWIYRHPQNAKVSIVMREKNMSSMTYKYYPMDKFIGKDTAVLILNKGSDGASPGKSDTTKICINVK